MHIQHSMSPPHRSLLQIWPLILLLLTVAGMTGLGLAEDADARSARGEYYEGKREIRREREEMRRDILNSNSRWEARQAYREGKREIRREKREMRREMRRSLNRRSW